MKNSRGLSLAETILALTLLLGALGVFLMLIQQSVLVQASLQRREAAALCARNRLEEIRAWSAQRLGASFQFFRGDWTMFSGWSDTQEPGMQVCADSSWHPLSSPATPLEAPFGQDQRVLNHSLRRVELKVRWSSKVRDQWSCIAFVPAPEQPLGGQLKVEGSVPGGALSPGASLSFRVKAQDGDGQSLDDLTYRWAVKPMGGNGTIHLSNRQGTAATFTNALDHSLGGISGDGPFLCRVQAFARYRGVELTAESDDILLAQP
ncbi:MAG: hypothetical protein U0931_41590 [Vulcanimicrobiota bacterium]